MKSVSRVSIALLLVEDSDSDAFLLENLLQEIQDLDFNIQRSQNLSQAKKLLLESEFEIVLLDLSLPDSSGLDTLSSLLEITDKSIVVLTGSPDHSLRGAAIRKGAQDYLHKSGLDSETLRRTIDYAIERQHLLSSLNQKIEELEISQARTRSMFDQSFDGIAVADQNGKFLYLNPVAEEIFGESEELLLGKPFGQEILETSIEIPKSDGTGHSLVELRKRNIKWEQESAWLVVLRDISERTELEAKLRQAQKLEAVGRLAGGIAHDFNNQLTAIMGFTELAVRTSDPQKVRNHLEHVRKATEKSAALTSQMLTFGRQQIIKPEPVCLNVLIQEIEKMLDRVIRKDIEIKIIAAPKLNLVFVDPTQIDQIIMNLVINASDAMQTGGQILIETLNYHVAESESKHQIDLPTGDYVQLSVSDNGKGMDKQTLSKIFEPFFSTKEVGKGTGLGLATVYGIVSQNNGHVWVYSEPGEGSVFKIYLPRTEIHPIKPRIELDRNTTLLMPAVILLVEDEPEVLDLIKTALELEGCEVICAENGVAALEKIRELGKPVDLILTDLIMPKMGGKELADTVAKEYPNTPIIYMSGYTRETILQNSILPEGMNLLQKPISPFSLIRCIKQIFTEAGRQP